MLQVEVNIYTRTLTLAEVVHTRVTFLGTLDTGFLQGNMAASPTAQHHQPQEPCLRTGHLHPVERYASTGWHRPPATQITKQLRLLFRITIRRSVHRCKHQRNPFMGLKATKFANVLIARAKPWHTGSSKKGSLQLRRISLL